MEAKVLTAQSLCKRYGTLDALDHVDLTLEPGHIYGLIGRNGAGKTTLLSALTAQMPVDAGTVTYGGAPVWENEAHPAGRRPTPSQRAARCWMPPLMWWC